MKHRRAKRMSQPEFTHLLSPASIGAMRLKNRMVMSPMTTAYCNDDQTPSERLIHHFEARAKGGVGLITLELTTVDVAHPYLHRSMTLGDDRFIDVHRPLVDAIHQHGAKVQPQISHTGPESVAPLFGGAQAIGPSVSVAPVWGWHSRELSVGELPAIAIQYGEAARRAREAGYDGMELHAAHCYNLLGSFLSPLRNKRTDDYSAFKQETRLRIFVEVLAEIRARAGNDFPVTLSISGYERYPGGRGLEDTAALAPLLVDAGVDCFRVSGGISDSLVTQMVSRSEAGDAMNAANAESIRNVVDVPIMAVGRIHDPLVAERVLATGQADLVAMARPLLADPELPNKVASGRYQQVRRCISCEHCIDSMQTNDNLTCAVNPLSGREGELKLRDHERKQGVLVIGGGPAGMEAARLACEAGHRVTLLEKKRALGGTLLLAATVHSDNGLLLDYLKAEMARLPIQLMLGTEATPSLVRQLKPDAIVVASGALVTTPAIDGCDLPHVLTGARLRQLFAGELGAAEGTWLKPWQRQFGNRVAPWVQRFASPRLLQRLASVWLPLANEVAIIGADLAATELAEFLARRGRRVHLLEPGNKIAPEVGKKRRAEHMDRLDALKVTLNTRIEVVRIDTRGVLIRAANGVEKTVAAGTVIIAGDIKPNGQLAARLEDDGFSVHQVGDCSGLGLIAKATRTAAEAVAALDSPAQ